MRIGLGLSLLLLAVLGACDRRPGIFADRSIPVVVASASAASPPRFVGRWAASAGQCRDPWVFEARSLTAGPSSCEFDKIDVSSAGYAIAAICRSGSGPTPTRLVIVAPAKPNISLLTISGGPFKGPTPLQRCAAP